MFEKVINGAKVIVQGWAYVALDELGVLPVDIKTLAEKRIIVCNNCEYGGWYCKDCGCPLTAKTKSPDADCRLGKWKDVK